jgi:hypothetical protein
VAFNVPQIPGPFHWLTAVTAGVSELRAANPTELIALERHVLLLFVIAFVCSVLAFVWVCKCDSGTRCPQIETKQNKTKQ